MMCAINPMSASILGALVLHEQMTSSKLLGCLLILGGLLVHFARRMPSHSAAIEKNGRKVPLDESLEALFFIGNILSDKM